MLMVRPVWHGPGDTLWADHSSRCLLELFHCHVGDQIYYSDDEFLAVYPDGQLPDLKVAPVGTPLEKVKEWISVGFTNGGFVSGPRPASRSDHSNHVHVSLNVNQPVSPGQLIGIDPKTGTVRPYRPGDTPSGFVQGSWEA